MLKRVVFDEECVKTIHFNELSKENTELVMGISKNNRLPMLLKDITIKGDRQKYMWLNLLCETSPSQYYLDKNVAIREFQGRVFVGNKREDLADFIKRYGEY